MSEKMGSGLRIEDGIYDFIREELLMTQRDRIRKYMQDFGSISPFEAYRDLGITKLATRISEMISEGEKIEKIHETGKNRYGDPIWWTRYSLEAKDGQ